VCGLKVHCDADRRFVQVHKGYAIACDGTDLLMEAATRHNVVSLATARKLLDAKGDGAIELLLDKAPGSPPAFDVRADPGPGNKTILAQILEGTLFKDVLDDCIQPVIDFFQDDLFKAEPNDRALVPEVGKNRIAALNMVVQFANKSAGANVFLSRDEHNRLTALYQRIRKFIAVKAYCGMFDGLKPMPAYPFDDLGIRTMSALRYAGSTLRPMVALPTQWGLTRTSSTRSISRRTRQRWRCHSHPCRACRSRCRTWRS
jgi:hypothetical protein